MVLAAAQSDAFSVDLKGILIICGVRGLGSDLCIVRTRNIISDVVEPGSGPTARRQTDLPPQAH